MWFTLLRFRDEGQSLLPIKKRFKAEDKPLTRWCRNPIQGCHRTFRTRKQVLAPWWPPQSPAW
jgi:hypothetical protein